MLENFYIYLIIAFGISTIFGIIYFADHYKISITDTIMYTIAALLLWPLIVVLLLLDAFKYKTFNIKKWKLKNE